MKKALVLGSGMVGKVMAKDIAQDSDFHVTVADVSEQSLTQLNVENNIITKVVDLSDPDVITKLAVNYDIILGALPSRLGFSALEAVIRSGRPYCDISFMPEDASELNDLAVESGVTAIVDCGVAPGMSNLLSGYACNLLDECSSIEIYVGGLPVERYLPYQYKAGFSPYDVIEEYTRPSRMVENGNIITREALSEPEFISFPGIGTLEAFNTDGLRSLINTLNVPEMKEKTLRYPGHIEIMRVLRDTGYFSKEEIEVSGKTVRPLDLTAELLFPVWEFNEGEADLTVMRVTATGVLQGKNISITWDLLDYYDPASGHRSMSRTTGYTCSVMARQLAMGRINRKGVIFPEMLGGDDKLVDVILGELTSRGISYRMTQKSIKTR